MSTEQQMPTEVYDTGDQAEFNILHAPADTKPCKVGEDGKCHNLDHLQPIAKPKADA